MQFFFYNFLKYEAKGFDRLIESGFTEEEIEETRSQFYRNKKELIELIKEGKISDLELYEMEDKWINDENQTRSNATNLEEEDNENSQGDFYDLFFGLIFGFFLSFIALIWVRISLEESFFFLIFSIRCWNGLPPVK